MRLCTHGPCCFKMFARQAKRLLEMKNLLVVNLLCLSVNLFFLVMQLNQGLWPVETFFQQAMSEQDKSSMKETLRVFTTALDAANLTYFMYSGTLIGSWRHHGPIPWDDDVDVMLNASQKVQARQVLQALRPQFDMYTDAWEDEVQAPGQWKFYLASGSGFVHKSFKWPYVDIFFFRENSTHIWDETPRYSEHYLYPKNIVFPLSRRPFGGLSLHSPCDPLSVLNKNYNLDQCRARQFSHQMELPMLRFKTKDVPCHRLHHLYPFVHRAQDGNLLNETLRLGDWTLQSVSLSSVCSAES